MIIKSEYNDARNAPLRIRVWEQQVGMAETSGDTQTQMLYAIAVETYKLRVAVQWALIWTAVLIGLGIVLWLSVAIAA